MHFGIFWGFFSWFIRMGFRLLPRAKMYRYLEIYMFKCFSRLGYLAICLGVSTLVTMQCMAV